MRRADGVNFVHGRREEAARDAARLLAHGGDAPAFGDGAFARAVSHERTSALCRAPDPKNLASARKDRLAAQPGFEHAPAQLAPR
jgi:hypothetical protein